MLILSTIAAIFVAKASSDEDLCNSRTVLFKDLDVSRDCWTLDETLLLNARKHMQELIPKTIPDNLSLILKYFKWCLMSLKSLETSGDVQMILLSALGDTIGGYLQHVIVPVVNDEYYAGNVDYMLTHQIHSLLDAVKEILETDGGGWALPISPSAFNTKIYPLWLNLSDFDDACKALILDCKHSCASKPPTIMIPMPFFDDNDKPNAVAMPFRCRSLFNLRSPLSADILLRYYSLSMRCLMVTKSRGNVLAFNTRFQSWILTQVTPHLQECDWYPGFWGVKRIVERMRLMEGINSGAAGGIFRIKPRNFRKKGVGAVLSLQPHKKDQLDDDRPCFNNDTMHYHLAARKSGHTQESSKTPPFVSGFNWTYVLLSVIGSLVMCCCSACVVFCCRSTPPIQGPALARAVAVGRTKAAAKYRFNTAPSSLKMLYDKRIRQATGGRRRGPRIKPIIHTSMSSTDESAPRTLFAQFPELNRKPEEVFRLRRKLNDDGDEWPSDVTSGTYCPPCSTKITVPGCPGGRTSETEELEQELKCVIVDKDPC